jgi:ribosomal protein S6--L-glutamate ligase
MAKANCERVFPDHGARFAYTDKIGQIQLFREAKAPIPPTRCFPNLNCYTRKHPDPEIPPLDFPLVVKFNWGGEGETVFPIGDSDAFKSVLDCLARCEKTGQKGFLIQDRIDTRPRGGALRVVVIGKRMVSYWRITDSQDQFCSSLSQGARIDHHAWAELQKKGVAATEKLCARTGINLAGFDLIFSDESPDPPPLFLEINYFFGRQGLGGSAQFYQYLNQEVTRWLTDHELE